jgi:hypothetical protein
MKKHTIKLNDAHVDHKEALTLRQLDALADAKFTDVSWASNECASFASPCQNYELFVNLRTDNVADEYQACVYDKDGFSEFLGGCNDLTVAMQKIQAHKKGIK